MRSKPYARYAYALVLAALVGCSALPGLSTLNTVISGTISGSGVGPQTKLAVFFGVAAQGTPPDAIVPVGGDGSFSYSIPSDRTMVSLVPFQDKNGTNMLDPGDPNALAPSTCSSCDWIVAAKSGDSWTVSITGGTGGSQTASLGTADMQFNAA